MSDPNTVERTPRQVIEGRLLTSLAENQDQVAVLFSKEDLEALIAALKGYKIFELNGKVLSSKKFRERCANLTEGMEQLLKEAFKK